MKTVTLWKTKTNLAGGYVFIGVRFSKDALKARGTIAKRLSYDTFRKLLVTNPLQVCWRLGFAVALQRVQTRACWWRYPCAI